MVMKCNDFNTPESEYIEQIIDKNTKIDNHMQHNGFKQDSIWIQLASENRCKYFDNIKELWYDLDYDDITKANIDSYIHEKIFEYQIKYNIDERLIIGNKTIQAIKDKYVKENNLQKSILKLYINNSCVEIFNDIEIGKRAYDKILQALVNNERFVNLQEVKHMYD